MNPLTKYSCELVSIKDLKSDRQGHSDQRGWLPLRKMFRLDGRGKAVTLAAKTTRNPPEPQKAKNQPLSWFL
jgi:hypothetical protein